MNVFHGSSPSSIESVQTEKVNLAEKFCLSLYFKVTRRRQTFVSLFQYVVKSSLWSATLEVAGYRKRCKITCSLRFLLPLR